MREFFHGWRRKFGVVTLVMACVVIFAHVRGHFYDDGISTNIFPGAINLATNKFGFRWVWARPVASPPYLFFFSNPMLKDADAFSANLPRNRRELFGVFYGWGMNRKSEMDFVVVIASHWFAIVPLAGVSACLRLSKPRVAKPPESTKPPDEPQVTHA